MDKSEVTSGQASDVEKFWLKELVERKRLSGIYYSRGRDDYINSSYEIK